MGKFTETVGFHELLLLKLDANLQVLTPKPFLIYLQKSYHFNIYIKWAEEK